MSNPLFSRYRQGENRITASIMAVFERVNLTLVERILQAILQASEVSLVTFANQPKRSGGTRPDARISARFSYWFEAKTTANAVDIAQLRGHLKSLTAPPGDVDERLVVISPDRTQPQAITTLADKRVVWTNYMALDEAISKVMEDQTLLLSERDRFLLGELRGTLLAEHLVGLATEQVLIVPARFAYDTYLTYSAYWCQPNRTFRTVNRMGFYREGVIETLIPQIVDSVDELSVAEGVEALPASVPKETKERLRTLIELARKDKRLADDQIVKVVLLSDKDSPDTLRLDQPIKNDLTSDSGRAAAWVQNQRYVSIESIQKAKTTSALKEE